MPRKPPEVHASTREGLVQKIYLAKRRETTAWNNLDGALPGPPSYILHVLVNRYCSAHDCRTAAEELLTKFDIDQAEKLFRKENFYDRNNTPSSKDTKVSGSHTPVPLRPVPRNP